MSASWPWASTSEQPGAGPQSGPAPGWSLPLSHPEVVAGGIAEPRVDPVRLLGRLLRELDAAALQLLVARPAVVGREEEPAGRALREQLVDRCARLLVEDRRAGDRHQCDRNVLAGDADRQPT